MEIKKTPKADLENRRTLYTEIGLVVALLVVWGAFSYSTKEKAVASLGEDTQVVEVEDMVPITQETPPPPPEAPKILCFPTRSTSLRTTSRLMTTL